jgi:dipeptidyl-peptidase-4
LNEAKAGKQVQVIENNESLAVKLKGYNLPSKEFLFKNRKRNELNAWMIKPKDFDPTKKISCFHVPIFRSRFTTSEQRVKYR